MQTVSDLMTNLSFTNAQMGATLAWVEDNNASYDEGACTFPDDLQGCLGGRGLTMRRATIFPHCCSKTHGQGHPQRCP